MSGPLAVGGGGSGFAAAKTAQAANFVYAGPVSAPAALPAFRALVEADIPALATYALTGHSHTRTWPLLSPTTEADNVVALADAGTNTAVNPLTLVHTSSNAAAAGFGAALRFQGRTTLTTIRDMGRIRTVWVGPTDASRTSKMVLSTYNVAAEVDAVTILHDGKVGIGVTPTALLHVKGTVNLDGTGVTNGTLISFKGIGSQEIFYIKGEYGTAYFSAIYSETNAGVVNIGGSNSRPCVDSAFAAGLKVSTTFAPASGDATGKIFGVLVGPTYNETAACLMPVYDLMIAPAVTAILGAAHYGVYISGTTGATDNYGIYQATTTAKNYFGGNVGIGTTAPAGRLHVASDGNLETYFDSNLTVAASSVTLALRGRYGSVNNVLTIQGGSSNSYIRSGTGGNSIIFACNAGFIFGKYDMTSRWAYMDGYGQFGIGVNIVPTSRLHVIEDSALTNTVTNVLTLGHNSSVTPAAGFGAGLLFQLESSTTENRDAAAIEAAWGTATDASRAAQLAGSAYDTAKREGWRIGANGSAATLGFFGVTPVVRPAALTTQLTTLTFTAPGTPDYTVQDFTQTSPWGFASKDEANTVLSAVANLQTRLAELETKLQALGLLN